LADKQPVSQLAEELQVQPSLIHLWINQVLTQAERAFERSPDNGRVEQAKDRRIEQLQAKLVQKNEVIAELMEDNVRQKKVAGEL
jgi:transposase-like protein